MSLTRRTFFKAFASLMFVPYVVDGLVPSLQEISPPPIDHEALRRWSEDMWLELPDTLLPWPGVNPDIFGQTQWTPEQIERLNFSHEGVLTKPLKINMIQRRFR